MQNLHLTVLKSGFYQIFVFYCLVLLIKSTSYSCFHFKSLPRHHEQQFFAVRQRQIKNEIMDALRHVADNETIESLIPKLFNLTNPDPTYVFLLPNTRKQKRLIMRKSDFEKATFPELSKVYIRLSRVHSKKFQDGQYFGPLHKSPHEPFYEKLQYSHESYDNSIDRINENVQTERNFIDYVQRLNQKMAKLTPTVHTFDLIESESKIKAEVITFAPDSYASSKYSKEKYKHKSEWEKLGLGGWRGDILIPTEKSSKSESKSRNAARIPTEIETPPPAAEDLVKPTAAVKQIDFTPTLQYNFLDDPEDNNIWDLPGKVSSDSGKLFTLENETLSQMPDVLEHYNNPKWPIAFSRDSHKDDDVFIARANDPFGYSTKYKLRNSTRSGREGGGGGAGEEQRKKRAVVDLYSMLKCATGCDPLIYKGYGCYCGFLGAGKPTDGIDKCCQQHDRCYDNSRCFAFQQYFVPYIWKCFQGQPVCAVDHGEWGGPGSCASQLCKCDLALVKCLRKFHCPRRRAVCNTSKFRMLQNFLLIF